MSLPILVSLLGLFPGPCTPGPQEARFGGQDLERAARVRDLGALRSAGGRLGEANQPELAKLLSRFDGGEIDLARLRADSLAIEPELLAGAAVAPQVSWTFRLVDSGRVLGSPVLDLAVGGDDLELVAVSMPDDAVFLRLDPWLKEGGRFEFVHDGEDLHTVDDLGGIELKAGDYVWVHDRQRETTIESSDRQTVFGGLFVHLGALADGSPDLRLLEVWSSFAQSPIVWDRAEGVYRTVVTLGLRVVAGARQPQELPEKIEVVLGTEGAFASASLGRVKLTAVGGASDVVFNCDRHGGEVALLTTLAGEQIAHTVRVQGTTEVLRLTPSSTGVAGFGLGEVRLTLERLAEDGYLLVGGGGRKSPPCPRMQAS